MSLGDIGQAAHRIDQIIVKRLGREDHTGRIGRQKARAEFTLEHDASSHNRAEGEDTHGDRNDHQGRARRVKGQIADDFLPTGTQHGRSSVTQN